MVRHNNMIHNVHLKFDWQDKVKTWFNQPGRKHRRRVLRKKKAALIAPNPTHKLRPIVRGQTNKYNLKIKLGRGFTVKELKEAGIRGLSYARSLPNPQSPIPNPQNRIKILIINLYLNVIKFK